MLNTISCHSALNFVHFSDVLIHASNDADTPEERKRIGLFGTETIPKGSE